MIARFIYTDCQSSGPFGTGAGKKFKSVVFPAAASSGSTTIDSLKDRMPRNSLSDGYLLPNVENSLTMAEFYSLPKSWAFAQIREDTFALERISTAGQCYGRNNRFDEGFVFSADAWAQITEIAGAATKPTQLRPVDFVHSTGWLNPRGDAEVEAATLDNGFYELEPDFREQLKTDLGQVKRLPNLGSLTAGFAQAQLSGSAVFVPKAQSKEFFGIVSILTRLTAPVFAWQTGFSDVWSEQRDSSLADGRNPHFILSNEEPSPAGSLATMWGELAVEAFASGIPGKLMGKIDDLATDVFELDWTYRAQGLSLLALAILLASPDEMAGKERLVDHAADLLEKVALPSAWREGASRRLLDPSAKTAYRQCSKSDNIEGLLSNIGGAE